MRKEDVIKSIRELSQQVMPIGTQVILFGSQARNDAHSKSDWDVLILLNKNPVLIPFHLNNYYLLKNQLLPFSLKHM